MYPHHEDSILKVIEYFHGDAEVLALILGGSLAHGLAGPASDIDVMIVVSEQAYEKRLRDRQLQFFNQHLCTYPGGYVDGKYIGQSFLKKVAGQGSEPARFAFLDAQVLFSHIDLLSELIGLIGRYPIQGKEIRLSRFYAQFEAWHWYVQEALKRNNPYLLWTSIGKLVLFGGRLILAHNEVLYPYHKWFLQVLEQVPDRPPDLLASIQHLYQEPTLENIERFYEPIKTFRTWSAAELPWPNQFMLDSEMNWLQGATPIDDL